MKDKYCELCEAKGLKSKLKFCRVNFDEGILLCENDMCVYPFGAAVVDSFLLKTSASEVSTEKQWRKSQAKSAGKCSTTQLRSTSNIQAFQFYWSNSDNLCWLDSVMTILVNNRCLQLCLQKYQPSDSILQQLYANFVEAQKLGANEQGRDILSKARIKVFQFLKRKMQCSLGVNDSALASLNVLLKDCSIISEKFSQECEFTLKCSSCGYTQIDRHNKLVVTFPNTTDDFSMPSGVFLRACYKCKAAGQKSQLDLKRLPPCVMVHFVEGVKNRDFLKSGFVCQGKEYELCQLIQYKKNPDHFIAWVRNSNGTHWAKIDDMQNVVCKWRTGHPSFPLCQVHIAVWERAKLYQRKSSAEEITAKTPAESKRVVSERKIGKATGTMPKALSENAKASESSFVSLEDDRLKDDRLKELSSRSNVPFSQHKALSEDLKDKQSSLVSSTDNRLNEASTRRIPSSLAGLYQNNDGENNGEVRDKRNDVLPSHMADERKSLGLETEGSSNKRKNTFGPYVPKKKRTLSSCISLGKDEEKGTENLENFASPIQSNGNRSMDASTNRSQWKGVPSVDKDKQGIVCGNQSDSGYSSPGSNSSCLSLPSTHCSREENLILNEIIDTLDEIELPGNRSCEKNSQKFDSVELKSSLTVLKSKTELVSGLGESNVSCTGNNMKETAYTNDLELRDLVAGLEKSILSCGQNITKETTFTSDLEMPECISNANIDLGVDLSVKGMWTDNGRDRVSELDLNRTLESPCDFADIETVSNCGTDFLDELESICFVASVEQDTSLNSTDLRLNYMSELSGSINDSVSKEVDNSFSTRECFKFTSCETRKENTLDCSNLSDLVELASTTKDAIPDPRKVNKEFSTADCTRFTSSETEQANKDMYSKKLDFSDLQRTMKMLIYNSENEANLGELSKTEESNNFEQNSVDGMCLLEQTKGANCDKELGNGLDPVLFSEKQKHASLSSNELNYDFQPIDLPEITEFMQLEAKIKKNNSKEDHSCFDILEEIFPSNLLDKEHANEAPLLN